MSRARRRASRNRNRRSATPPNRVVRTSGVTTSSRRTATARASTSPCEMGASLVCRASPRVTTPATSTRTTRCSMSPGPSGARIRSPRRGLRGIGDSSTKSACRTVGRILCPDPVTQISPPASSASRMSWLIRGAESESERFGNRGGAPGFPEESVGDIRSEIIALNRRGPRREIPL